MLPLVFPSHVIIALSPSIVKYLRLQRFLRILIRGNNTTREDNGIFHQGPEWHCVDACPLQTKEHSLLQMNRSFAAGHVVCPLLPAVAVPYDNNHE